MEQSLTYATASPDELRRVVLLIAGACKGEPPNNILMGSLAIAISLKKPGIEFNELVDTLKRTSEYIHLLVNSVVVEGETVN